jgi:hypothetical protein
MEGDLPTYNSEREKGLTWLREGLTALAEVCPLSYRQKKQLPRMIQKMPDWLIANWAESLSIEYTGGSARYPDIANQAKSVSGRDLAQQYVEAHDTVPVGFCLDQLCRRVIKLSQTDRLLVDADMVLRQVCALAWAECTEDGMAFARQASKILSDPENPNHPIVDYQIALERGEKEKLEKLDNILTGGRYGEWVDSRFDEAKRYLGIDTPVYRISFIERTPQWDAFWENIIKGGTND